MVLELESKANDQIRVIEASFSADRGAILVDSDPVAESEESDDRYDYQRLYPQPLKYAHLTGFFSRDYGLGGIEATQNSVLSGSDPRLFIDNRVIALAGGKLSGTKVGVPYAEQAQWLAWSLGRAHGVEHHQFDGLPATFVEDRTITGAPKEADRG